MKLILVEDIEKLGNAGDIVDVAPGYGRNYLLPKKIAIMATKNNMKKVESIKKEAEEKRLETINHLKAVALRLEGKELRFERKADEKGHLFGSVSENDIVDSLNAEFPEIKKGMVGLEKQIKEIMETEVEINLTSEINTKIKVIVEKEKEEE